MQSQACPKLMLVMLLQDDQQRKPLAYLNLALRDATSPSHPGNLI